VKVAYAGVDVTLWSPGVKNRQSPITNFGLALRDEPSEASVAPLIEFRVEFKDRSPLNFFNERRQLLRLDHGPP
jgi:hypothetical protein